MRTKASSISKKVWGVTVDMVFCILKVSANNLAWVNVFTRGKLNWVLKPMCYTNCI